MATNSNHELPDDIDSELWFPCSDVEGARDYLYAAAWHTFPGRMGAYCPAKQVSFRVSLSGIRGDIPDATRYWIKGYLAGNLPRQPDPDMDGEELERWKAKATSFFATGRWDTTESP